MPDSILRAASGLCLALMLVCSGTAALAQPFNLDKEAEAFLNRVTATEAPDQRTLRTLVEERFASFVLAATTKKPIYSAQSNAFVAGSIGPEDRIAAAKVLAPKLRTRDTERNQALRVLKGIIEQQASMQR